MTDELIERLSPYAVDGGFDAYGQMEADEFGDYVRFEDYQARILADAKIIEAADELYRATEFMTDNDPEDIVADGGVTAIMVGLSGIRSTLDAYRAAVLDR